MDQSIDIDVVVIGAGPAGSAAAMSARAQGASVAIIDKARFPRSKLCGGLITGRCAQHLHDVFGLDVDCDLFEARDDFEFFMDGAKLARMRDVPRAYLTMRFDLDAVLFDLALGHGAQDFSGRRVEDLDLDRRRLRLSDGTTLRFGVLIGADGVRSRVAEALFGQSFDPTKIGFALEIEDKTLLSGPQATIRVDFAAAAWGYGWSFPKKASTTIGVGGLQVENPAMKARLSAYLDMLGTGQDAKIKGHFLPFGGYRNRPGRGAVLLAGDAAGFVDPITGEGIGYAVQSGAMAGVAAAQAVATGTPDGAFARYLAATRPIRTALRCARLLRPVIFARPMAPFFASTFRASKTLKRDYMRLLAGQTEYPQIVARAFLRVPRAAIRFLWRKIRRPKGADRHGSQISGG
ncbi:MAG: geranylgeranyl reductase family protein [Pseudomonadota bacterium]